MRCILCWSAGSTQLPMSGPSTAFIKSQLRTAFPYFGILSSSCVTIISPPFSIDSGLLSYILCLGRSKGRRSKAPTQWSRTEGAAAPAVRLRHVQPG